MPKFNVTRKVPYSVEQVFEIAGDVGEYRKFMPLVKRSLVRNHVKNADGTETFDAELEIAYKKLGIKELMRSRVTIDRARKLVTAVSNEPPVTHLNAQWQINEVGPNACEIEFNVDYALKSRAMQFVLSGMFDMVVRRVMSAFEERARELYGPGTASA
jgi:coenzyme Q-binding protein COQ10